MNVNTLVAACIASAAVLAGQPAAADSLGYYELVDYANAQAAGTACRRVNPYQPAWVLSVAPDGMGDYNVVVVDRDGDRWNCNASVDGHIYWNDLD